MLTFAQFKAHATHAIGGDPDNRVDVGEVVNSACREIYHVRPWSFRVKVVENLAAVANQNWIALPTDCDSVLGTPQVVGNGAYGPVQVVDLMTLARLRQTPSARGGTVYVAFGAHTDARAPVMHLYPTPAANGVPTFTLTYLRKWVDLVNDNDVAALPDVYQNAIKYRVRAEAMMLEDDSPSIMLEAVAREIDRLEAEDAFRMVNVANVAPSGPRGDSLTFTNP